MLRHRQTSRSCGPSQGFPAGGSSTAFVTKLKPGGLGAVYSILWGGGADSGLAITADAIGKANIAGATTSFNSAHQFRCVSEDQTVAGSSISSFVTTDNRSRHLGFLDILERQQRRYRRECDGNGPCGDIYIAGDTSSTTFPGAPPITPNPTAGFPGEANVDAERPQLYRVSWCADQWSGGHAAVARDYPLSTYPLFIRRVIAIPVAPNANNTDAFVVKLDERPVLQTSGISGESSAR